MSCPEFAFTFKDFDVEEFFARRLHDHRREINRGLTTPAERRERIRTAIIEGKLDCTIIGRAPNNKPETYAESFERYYGEPLVPKVKRSRREPA